MFNVYPSFVLLQIIIQRICFSGDLKNSPRPVVLFIHGDSFDWGSGNLYDGAVMAAYSDLVVVTINYRLGVLGNLDFHFFHIFLILIHAR